MKIFQRLNILNDINNFKKIKSLFCETYKPKSENIIGLVEKPTNSIRTPPLHVNL